MSDYDGNSRVLLLEDPSLRNAAIPDLERLDLSNIAGILGFNKSTMCSRPRASLCPHSSALSSPRSGSWRSSRDGGATIARHHRGMQPLHGLGGRSGPFEYDSSHNLSRNRRGRILHCLQSSAL